MSKLRAILTGGVEEKTENVPNYSPDPTPSIIEINAEEVQSTQKAKTFHVDRDKIHSVASTEQNLELQNLGLQVYNQDEFEQGVLEQVDDAYAAEEEIRLNMVLEKEMKAIHEDVSSCKQEISRCDQVISEVEKDAAVNKQAKRRLNAALMQKENKERQMKRLEGRQKALIVRTQKSIEAASAKLSATESVPSVNQALGLGGAETDAERMVRLGEMTPFGSVMGSQYATAPSPARSQVSDFEKYLMDQDSKSTSKSRKSSKSSTTTMNKNKLKRVSSDFNVVKDDEMTERSHAKKMKKSKSTTPNLDAFDAKQNSGFKTSGKNSEQNYFDAIDKKTYRPYEKDFSNYKSRKASVPKLKHNFSGQSRPDYDMSEEYDSDDHNRTQGDSDQDYIPSSRELYNEGSEEEDERYQKSGNKKSRNLEFDLGAIKEKFLGKKRKSTSCTSSSVGGAGVKSGKDDGNIHNYHSRLKKWQSERVQRKHRRLVAGEEGGDSEEDSDVEIDGQFKVPAKIWNKLYRYQKTGVKWLWELHTQQCGGIVGDEMGLGKTIQMIAFLVGLHRSQLRDKGTNSKYRGLGPVIIVCPATVMHQWVKEFHTWWPPFRVAVLHGSGSYTATLSEKDLVHSIVSKRGVLITSYSSVVIYQELLLNYDWQYIVLDEGHKIRNPDAQVTLACKQFRTCHRIILSGSPMQNNLKELWSLFDFVFPGKLGTLPDFMTHFSVPITQGGYSNASEVQVQTAYKCACVLRDTINPYLLRRMKADVKTSINLPQKNEQVLFCRLTQHQRDVYKEYLDSKECGQILRGNYMVFPGLITLRKICNHPDLSTGGPRDFDPESVTDEEAEFGYFRRSGKMIVIESLLKMWKKLKHKVLIFTQGQQMLNVLEKFVRHQGYSYLRMDGGTGIAGRQALIQKFNQDPDLFLFLLTTRVGGLGVNLTGADRVVIFDPDWNPSTDVQARERAWRIGQNKQVTIYRLLTTGTIEEKIYHRQIFKQFLTNRVLKDPKQRRFFKSNDLFELFTLGADDLEVGTETSAIFAGTGSDVKVNIKGSDSKSERRKKKHKNRFDALREKQKRDKEEQEEEDPDIDMSGSNEGKIDFDEDKLAKMRELARKLSLQISRNMNKDKEKPSHSADSSAENTEKSSSGINDNITTQGEHKTNQKCVQENSKFENDSKSLSLKKDKEEAEMKKRLKRKEEEKRREREIKRKKKKKRSKHKDAVFEGVKISGLDRSRPYQTPVAGSDDEGKPLSATDDYVLQKLFKKSGGLHSAVQHDTIMQSSRSDYALVEGEADRVAREAARALRRSRADCYRAQTGRPTWTGSHGTQKPRFGQKKNTKLVPEIVKEKPKKESVKTESLFAPDPISTSTTKHFDGSIAGIVKTNAAVNSSLVGEDKSASYKQNGGAGASSTQEVMTSSTLLERMRARNYMTSGRNHSDDNSGEEDNDPWSGCTAVTPIDSDPQYVELITDIRNHIAFGCSIDGQASTDEIVQHFHTNIPPKDSAKFKAMLRQICTFEKREGMGVWRLKSAFR